MNLPGKEKAWTASLAARQCAVPGKTSGRKVMTLYRYVPGKDALPAGVVARVLTDLAINPAAADWRQELRDLATSHPLRP
jgi:hypothetical protein